MAKIESTTYILPNFWASALMNDDTSGFDDEEQEQFEDFCKDMDKYYATWHCVDITEDVGFKRWHDAAPYGVLGCDTSTFVFHVTQE